MIKERCSNFVTSFSMCMSLVLNFSRFIHGTQGEIEEKADSENSDNIYHEMIVDSGTRKMERVMPGLFYVLMSRENILGVDIRMKDLPFYSWVRHKF